MHPFFLSSFLLLPVYARRLRHSFKQCLKPRSGSIRFKAYNGGKGDGFLSLVFSENYDRDAAVSYARRWAYGRNPAYYDYSAIGGDCTNFASQCLYAGCGVMNYTPDFGWYYIDANNKAPAWTGVEYFYRFLTRPERSLGPVARLCAPWEVQPGDFVQLSFDGDNFAHTPVVVSIGEGGDLSDILVAAHSEDALDRPLSTYDFRMIRFLHVTGYWA